VVLKISSLFKEVTESTDLGAMIQLLKDATDIDCSIMGAVFGGGNSNMESHTRSCVDAIGSKELRLWRVETPASAKEGADNFASASRGGVDTIFSCEAARSIHEDWTGLSRAAANLLAGVASILPLARLDAWLATKCVMQVVSAASTLSAYEENNDGDDHETSPAARAVLLTSLQKGGSVNTMHSDVFTILLPRAIIGIHDHLRVVVEKVVPLDLAKVKSTSAAFGIEYDHANSTRVMTLSYVCPFL
jgi:hypothetical protein